jgi:integrase
MVCIIAEMDLRPYKELMSMRKSQVDFENRLVHIPDSKTPSGEADMPMPPPAWKAFQAHCEATPGEEYLFPIPKRKASKPYITTLRKICGATLSNAGVPYFPLYELRYTFATRLSAGGAADHFVSQMLRHGDAGIFKRYGHAKPNMMREALDRLDRRANEHRESSGTPQPI